MIDHLDVLRGHEKVAGLRRTLDGTLLTYEAGAQSISSSLPARNSPIRTTGALQIPAFFHNLLPEGDRYLRIADRAGVARSDFFGVLAAGGDDAIGDIAIRHAGQAFEPDAPFEPAETSFMELYERRYGANSHLSERASLPGAQAKVSLGRLANSRFGIQGMILKLAIGAASRPELIQNEAFFMRMADDVGVETAKTRLLLDRHGEPGLAVARFDRVKSGRELVKLHVEDGCQILDILPAQRQTVDLRQVAIAVQAQGSAPTTDILRLIQQVAFSYLIGNGEMNVKNLCLVTSSEGVTRLSPAYDLLSTCPYGNDTMSLALDRRRDHLKARHFIEFGDAFGVPDRATRNMLQNLVTRSRPWIDRLRETHLGPWHRGNVEMLMRDRLIDLEPPSYIDGNKLLSD